MSGCCGTETTGGTSGGATAAPSEWVERYLGDFTVAPTVDLSDPTPPNPTVTVLNSTTTPGQVASVEWTSNAGDALGVVTQGTVVAFETNTNGLVFEGSSVTNQFTASSTNAAHIWCSWEDLLGETPRAGVDICVQVRFSLIGVGFINEGAGHGTYTPNDGVFPTSYQSSQAELDEIMCKGWWEFINGDEATILGLTYRQGTSSSFDYRQLVTGVGTNDTAGLIYSFGSSITTAIQGESVNGVLPEPQACESMPGSFIGDVVNITRMPFLEQDARVAIGFQSWFQNAYDSTVTTFRVLTRGGLSS